jgi:hypothetical protein
LLARRSVEWYNQFKELFIDLIKLSLHLSSDPEIPLVNIYPREM